MTGEIGTTQWMAPEMLRGEPYDASIDVYSFGIVMWELLTLRHPFAEIPERNLVYKLATQNIRPPIPKDAPPDYVRLMERCWDRDPRRRPTAAQVLQDITNMLNRWTGRS